MAYTKTTWVNGAAPPISAQNLNKIEQGVYNANKWDDLFLKGNVCSEYPITFGDYTGIGATGDDIYVSNGYLLGYNSMIHPTDVEGWGAVIFDPIGCKLVGQTIYKSGVPIVYDTGSRLAVDLSYYGAKFPRGSWTPSIVGDDTHIIISGGHGLPVLNGSLWGCFLDIGNPLNALRDSMLFTIIDENTISIPTSNYWYDAVTRQDLVMGVFILKRGGNKSFIDLKIQYSFVFDPDLAILTQY